MPIAASTMNELGWQVQVPAFMFFFDPSTFLSNHTHSMFFSTQTLATSVSALCMLPIATVLTANNPASAAIATSVEMFYGSLCLSFCKFISQLVLINDKCGNEQHTKCCSLGWCSSIKRVGSCHNVARG